MELLGSYSNPVLVGRFQRLLAGQEHDRLSARSRPSGQCQHRLSADEVSALVSSYEDGATITDLAERFQVSRTAVRDHLKRSKVETRYNLLQGRLEEAQQLYDSGWSLARVAAHLEVSAGTVRNAFQRAGIPT